MQQVYLVIFTTNLKHYKIVCVNEKQVLKDNAHNKNIVFFPCHAKGMHR